MSITMQLAHPEATTTAVIDVDPANAHGITPSEALAACGYITDWALNRERADETMAAAIERQYQYYQGQMQGGQVAEEGMYLFPGDPPLAPYIRMRCEETGETLYQYPYSIVAIINPGRPMWVSRCD